MAASASTRTKKATAPTDGAKKKTSSQNGTTASKRKKKVTTVAAAAHDTNAALEEKHPEQQLTAATEDALQQNGGAGALAEPVIAAEPIDDGKQQVNERTDDEVIAETVENSPEAAAAAAATAVPSKLKTIKQEPKVASVEEEKTADGIAEETFNAAHAAARAAGGKRRGGGRGIQIFRKGDTAHAVVPQNGALYLDAIVEVDAHPADDDQDVTKKFKNYELDTLYVVTQEVSEMAFGDKSSSKTLAQAAKRNLAKSKVIRIVRPGKHKNPAVIALLVDSWEAKAGHQGSTETDEPEQTVTAKRTPGRKKTSTSRKQASAKKTRGGARPNAGRPTNAERERRRVESGGNPPATRRATAPSPVLVRTVASNATGFNGLTFGSVEEVMEFATQAAEVKKSNPTFYEKVLGGKKKTAAV